MRTLALPTSAVVLASGCTFLFPLDERDETSSSTSSSASTSSGPSSSSSSTPSSSGNGGGADEGGGGSASSGEGNGGGGEGGCNPQPSLDEDPNHCGECGRACGEAVDGSPLGCSEGRCEVSVVRDFGGGIVMDLLGRREGEVLGIHFTSSDTAAHLFGLVSVDATLPQGAGLTNVASGSGPRIGGLGFAPEVSLGAIASVAVGGGLDRLHFGGGADNERTIPQLTNHHLAFGQFKAFEAVIVANDATDDDLEDGDDEDSLVAYLRTPSGFGDPLELGRGGDDFRGIWEVAFEEPGTIYWTQLVQSDHAEGQGGLRRIVLQPFAIEAIDAAPDSRVVALERDATFVYWADCANGDVLRLPHDAPFDDEPELVWAAEEPGRHPIALAVDAASDGSVFVVDTTDAGRCGSFLSGAAVQESRLIRVPKGDASSASILAVEHQIVTVDAPPGEEHVYFVGVKSTNIGSRLLRVHR